MTSKNITAVAFTFIIFLLLFLSDVTKILAQEIDSLNTLDATTEAETTFVPPPNTQPVTLTISPATLLLETDPGKTVTSSFQVFNNSIETENLKVSLLKFSADQTGSAPILHEFTPEDEYEDWLTFNTNTFSIEPKTWQTVQIYFNPPENAALSYYYAIVVSRQTSESPKEGETAVIGAPALLTLVTVNSPYAKQELQLKSFRATKKLFEFLPVEFELTVENTGNIHLAPVGNIFIDGFNKKDAGVIQINRTNGLILPGSTRTYTLKWEDGFPQYTTEAKDNKVVLDKNGKPKQKLSWDFSKANLFRIGRYTGHLVFIYDNGVRDVPTESRVSFWVLPLRILTLGGIILTLALLGIFIPIIWIIKKINKAPESQKSNDIQQNK